MSVFFNKLIKYFIVGGSGLIIDFVTTWICKEKLRANKYIANSIGFIVAASTNYIFNRIWTFKSQNPEILKEYLSFFIISLIGLVVNNFMLWIIHEKLNTKFYMSKLIAIIITTLWNFAANYYFTFG